MENGSTNYFYCYSLRLYHFICAFNGKCKGSSVNKVSGNRYWTFEKSAELDEVIILYNQLKHSRNLTV